MVTQTASHQSPQTATPSPASVQREQPSEHLFQPVTDILQTEQAFVVVAEMPGAKPDSIEVDLDRGVLTVRARVGQRGGEHLRLREYAVGDYYRSFRVPAGIDAAGINADFKDGVLTVHIPKHESVKPRRIPVKAQA